MTIRPMMIFDYPQLDALWQEDADHANDIGDRDSLRRFLERNPDTCFVAELGGMIVGSILAGHDGRTAILYRRVVGVLFRHRGIEIALLNTVIRTLHRAGVATLMCIAPRIGPLATAPAEDGFVPDPDAVPCVIDVEARYPRLPAEDRIC